jgi:hypothetical protein
VCSVPKLVPKSADLLQNWQFNKLTKFYPGQLVYTQSLYQLVVVVTPQVIVLIYHRNAKQCSDHAKNVHPSIPAAVGGGIDFRNPPVAGALFK